MSTSELGYATQPLRQGVIVIGGMLAVMWALEIIDAASFQALDQFGIAPREFGYLPHILTAPWLHFGWSHIINNSIPFLVLGLIVWLGGVRRWLFVTAACVLSSGLLVWLIAPEHTITVGVSGLIFGYLAYVLVRGFFTRSIWQLLVAVVVFSFYGSVLFGLLPGAAGISWQGHLGGALGGIWAAWRERRVK